MDAPCMLSTVRHTYAAHVALGIDYANPRPITSAEDKRVLGDYLRAHGESSETIAAVLRLGDGR